MFTTVRWCVDAGLFDKLIGGAKLTVQFQVQYLFIVEIYSNNIALAMNSYLPAQ